MERRATNPEAVHEHYPRPPQGDGLAEKHRREGDKGGFLCWRQAAHHATL